MQPYVHMLVSLGQWAQAHHNITLIASCVVIVTLGIARFTWRTALHARRPRL
jgi:hypothetical protein